MEGNNIRGSPSRPETADNDPLTGSYSELYNLIKLSRLERRLDDLKVKKHLLMCDKLRLDSVNRLDEVAIIIVNVGMRTLNLVLVDSHAVAPEP